MDEIKDLSIYRLKKAKDDFEISKSLFEQKHFAQSINRSYYSIFHAVRALLAFDKFDSRKHSGIIAFFDKNYIKSDILDKKLSKLLHDAEKYRIKSDYDDFYIASKDEAEIQLTNAAIFINEIENYIARLMEK